jgi:fatty acid desaturase
MCNELEKKPSTKKGKPKYDMVRPAPSAPIVRRMAPGELNNVQHTLDIQPSATMHVEMRTSAVDRSKGFLVATVPLFAGLALGLVLISVFFLSVPFLSLTALVIFWLSFVGAWLVAYGYTLAVSAEGIALFEAKSKWDVVKREQAERWNYYNKQDGQ